MSILTIFDIYFPFLMFDLNKLVSNISKFQNHISFFLKKSGSYFIDIFFSILDMLQGFKKEIIRHLIAQERFESFREFLKVLESFESFKDF